MTKLTYIEEIEAIIRDARAHRAQVVAILIDTVVFGAWSSRDDDDASLARQDARP